MCFSKSPKTPKTNPDAIPAPEPVLTEEPKGVAVGDEDSTKNDVEEGSGNGKKSLKVEKDTPEQPKVPSDEDTKKAEIIKTATPKKVKGLGSIKKAMATAAKAKN